MITMFRKKTQLGKKKNSRGQSIAEYTMFISVVVMALLAMQIYLKRGIQGKLKDMADAISPESYSPNGTFANFYSNRSTAHRSEYEFGIATTQLIGESINRTGIERRHPEMLP